MWRTGDADKMAKKKFPGEYPPDWTEIALRTKDVAGWRCVRCNHHHSPQDGRTLTVHHLDGNKANCKWWNLVALCQACHLRIQGRVDLLQYYMFGHSSWFRPYVAGYYAHVNGLSDDYDYVMQNIDAILGDKWRQPENRHD
jgi:hypothetical protein